MLRCVDLNNIIEVGPMNEQQAMALIRKKLGEKLSSEYDSDDIKKLANSLECIPLALAQAAAYIRQRAPKFSVQQYVEKVDELNKSTKLLDRNDINLRRDGDASHSVMLTWRVSFEHLRKFKQSAADLLSLMSFFDRQAIPEAPLRRRRLRSWTIDQAGVVSRGAFVDWKSVRDDEIADDERDATFDASYEQDAEAFDEDLVLLRNYSFVSLTEVKTDYKMHRLVQIATQDWLRSMGHLSRWTSQFIDNLSEAFPKKPKFQDWKSCRQLFAHSVRALEVDVAWHEGLLWHAYLLRHSGNFASAVGLSAQSAQVMLGRSVELHTKVLGHVHRYTLSNKQDLAYCMYKEAKYNDAESLGREVLEAIETALRYIHDRLHNCAKRISNDLCRNSRRNGAEEDAIITQGFDHSSRKDINVFAMDIKNDLALVYVKQDRLPEAENLQLEVLDAYKVAHGKEHSNTLVAMENLAMTLALQKRFTEAQRLGRKVLNLREKDPGPNHPMTLMSMYNLACMQLDQESVGEETEKLITQVVDGRRKLFGDDNPTTLWSLRSLGSLRLMQCRWQDAKEILDVCYTKGITICGPEHPHTLLSMQDLARANRHLERPDEAYNLMRPCLTAMVQVHGAEHSRTVTARKILERWEKEDADRQENIAQSTGPSDLCPQVAQPTGRSEQRAPGRPENRVFTSRIPTRIRRT
jgi:tetratricopeptide (TPR) repeat protein